MMQKPVSRRDMLKILAAAGSGLAAAAFLPAKWLKPMVNAGVLPAHAAASCVAYTITAHDIQESAPDVIVFSITLSPVPPPAAFFKYTAVGDGNVNVTLGGVDVASDAYAGPGGVVTWKTPSGNSFTTDDKAGFITITFKTLDGSCTVGSVHFQYLNT